MSTTDTTAGAPDHDGVVGRDRADPEVSASPAGESPAPGRGVGSVDSSMLTRRGRVRKWDRPPPPHDWRWFVGALGKILIALGLLMFGFVGYQLYGTGIQTAAAQNQLENDFEELLAATTPVTEPEPDLTPADPSGDEPAEPAESTEPAEPPESETPEGSTVVTVPADDQNLIAVENGDALARIEIPAIGVDDIVVAGVTKGDLQRGPGHFPDTPVPGQLGNSAIAGHRTTYGQPFRNVDDLVPGDDIRVTTLNGLYVYRITGQEIVSPSDYQVVATTDPATANLTLVSCHPVFTARERIVIFSELVPSESAPVGEPILNYGRDDEPEDTETTEPIDDATRDTADSDDGSPTNVVDPTNDVEADVSTGSLVGSTDSAGSSPDDSDEAAEQVATVPPDAVDAGIADAFSDSWFSDPGADAQVGLWGAVLSAIALASYAVSRSLRRDWAGLLFGIVPFTVALYFFFQNVNRLLPPNL